MGDDGYRTDWLPAEGYRNRLIQAPHLPEKKAVSASTSAMIAVRTPDRLPS